MNLLFLADAPDALTTAEATLLVGVLNLIALVVVAIIAYYGKKHAKNADDAVNNVPKGSPRLMELVMHVHEELMDMKEKLTELVYWRRSYKNSPWNDGEGVKKWLAEHTERQKHIAERVDTLESGCKAGTCREAVDLLKKSKIVPPKEKD